MNCSKQTDKVPEQLSKFDDASWHYDNDYPIDLEEGNASTHIGMYLKWCINNNLISAELQDGAQAEIEEVKKGKISGATFLNDNCDGKFLAADLNDIGKKFTNDYYEGESNFSKRYGFYLDDYSNVFENIIKENSVYHLEDNEANYQLIKVKLDERFNEWKEYNSK